MKCATKIASVAVFIMGVIACATTPVTNRKALNFIPDEQMQSMGAQAFQEFQKTEKESRNAQLKEVVERVGRRIANASGADFEWEFEVFDNPKTVNAFCLPGGKIGVYTGLLPIAKNEAGLAAILGHEVAHATARHAAERMSQGLILQAGLTATDISLANSRYRGGILAALGVGAQFGVLLPYSRMHESEADRIGLEYMARAGYDPREAAALWDRMAAQGSAHPPEFLATHPNPSKRADEIRNSLGGVLILYEQSQKQPAQEISF